MKPSILWTITGFVAQKSVCHELLPKLLSQNRICVIRLREAHKLWVSEKSMHWWLGLSDKWEGEGEKCMIWSFMVCTVYEPVWRWSNHEHEMGRSCGKDGWKICTKLRYENLKRGDHQQGLRRGGRYINTDFKETGWGECRLDSVSSEYSRETSGSLQC